MDKDTLLVARDWGPGTMSEAGYPITVRKWKRGTPLESAMEIYRGSTKDNGYGDDPDVLVDGQGHRVAMIERSTYHFRDGALSAAASGPKKLGLPLKSRIEGLQDNQLIVSLDEDWKPEGGAQTICEGSRGVGGCEGGDRGSRCT